MIGDLYDTRNVVVGQAAVLIAPANTPNVTPSATAPVMSDAFSLTPWSFATVALSGGPLTAGTFTLAYTLGGRTYTTTAIQWNATNTAVAGDIVNALAPLGALASDVTVGGTGLPSAGFTITLSERLKPESGTWVLTPTGITGGTLSITNPVWVPVGATDQGWTWAASKNLQDITIEEQSTLVDRLVTSQQFTITGALSEDISATLALVFNMTVAGTAPTSTVPSYNTLTLTDTPTQYAVALIMQNAGGFPRWLYIPATTCLANVSSPLRRAAAKRMYTAEFTSVCETGLITVTEITGAHT